MAKKKNDNKIIKYPKQYHFSIGFVIIGVMFIYMIYHLFTYITSDNITIYEVSHGSISSNLEYNALALRDETVYTAETSGNIIYLAENFGRIGVKTNIYAVDESGDIVTKLDVESLADEKIDTKSLAKLQSTVSTFMLEYQDLDYYKVYGFKNELDSQIAQLYNVSAMNAMEDQVNAAIEAGTFHVYQNPTPGLVVYSTDGYENINIDNFTIDMMDSSSVSITNLKSQDTVSSGQPVYKVVNSDNWNLICEISDSLYESLLEDHYIKIQFLEDDISTWTSFELTQKAGKNFIIMSLDDGMERYADSRFVHIKLLDNNISGLKIPNSSIVNKEFFTIPKSCFYQGNNSNDRGVNIVRDANTTEFISPTIYYETDDYYYVDNEVLHKGDLLVKSQSQEKYYVGSETDKLQGVYNVNKGYAVFKQIEILFQNEDYAIIKTGTNYGIAMYDHIVLQGDEVEENTIIN